ncbi:MAG TPA: hypothetical protein VH062_32250 [Polyangiaceae bacterium]|jgi:hypothetical protein|nr:hypothetical protein [Polyangiaceae bacterium]
MTRFSSVLFAPGLLFALASAPRPARAAQSASAKLVWERAPGAESCIDRERLEESIERRWRRHVFVADGEDFVVEGHVSRGASGEWAASLALRSADGTNLGERQLVTRAPSCVDLDDSLVLALGIMLDLNRQKTGDDVGHPAAALGIRPANTVPLHVVPFAGAAASAGALPGLALGFRAGVALLPPAFMRVQLSGSVYAAENVSSARPGARMFGWAAELAAFPFSASGGPLRADFGAGVRLTELYARGLGLYRTESPSEALPSLGPRVELSLRIAGPLALDVGLGVDAALSRYRFVYRDSSGGVVSVYETAPFFGEIGVGLAVLL